MSSVKFIVTGAVPRNARKLPTKFKNSQITSSATVALRRLKVQNGDMPAVAIIVTGGIALKTLEILREASWRI